MNQITKPPITKGVHNLSREDYDADPAPEPSLSSSIAKLLINRSPAHARLAHPRLNPEHEQTHDRKYDLGTLCHAMLLGEQHKIVAIDAADFRTKAAKAAREEALEEGRVPALAHMVEQANTMAKSARRQLDASEHKDAFQEGVPEQTLVWQEGAVWCRARLDWLPHDQTPIFYDYKTTGASANPIEWERTLYNTGGDIQEAFYRRGIQAVFGHPFVQFFFVVQETEPPYALSVCALSGEAQALADQKVMRAIGIWNWCLEHKRWPGYSRETAYIFPPVWEQRREEDVQLQHQGKPTERMKKLLIEWMSP